MARQRGTNSRRYRSRNSSPESRGYRQANNYIEDAKQRNKDKRLKRNNPKKYKRRKQIAKFSRDGKITKKEGRKLAKKGVSLNKIRNRNVSEYRKASRNDDSVRFEPLKIKRGAERADFDRQMKDHERRTGKKPSSKRGNRNNRGGGGGGSAPKNDYGKQADDLLDDIDDQIVKVDPIKVDDVLESTPKSIYDKSTRTDGKDLKLDAADRSRKMGTKAFKRRRQNRAAKRRRQMRINKSLNL